MSRRRAIYLIHGWAMHAGLFEELEQRLSGGFEVVRVDLPGHGGRPLGPAGFALEAVLDELLANAPADALWCGWSLGGQLALAAALRSPQRIGGVLVMAGTPRFTTGEGWPAAMAPALLSDFAAQLVRDYPGTIGRFLGLQVRGLDDAASQLRNLRRRVLGADRPRPEALVGGLALLKDLDLRAELAAIGVPVHWLLGERDTLVPAAIAAELERLRPGMKPKMIPKAGHAPFLSHPEEVARFVAEVAHA